MKNLYTILAISLSFIAGIHATSGDEGGPFITTCNYQMTVRPAQVVSISPAVTIPITPSHILSLKKKGKNAIKADHLSEFKRIVYNKEFIHYPEVHDKFFKQIISSWVHLRNPSAYLNRLDQNRLFLLTKEVLIWQFMQALDYKFEKQIRNRLRRYKSFFDTAQDILIKEKQCTVKECMQHSMLKRLVEALEERNQTEEGKELRAISKRMLSEACKAIHITQDQLDAAGISAFALETK